MVMDPKELFGKDYNAFCEKDPFNPGYEVEGFISRKPTEYYGAMIIMKVNGRKVSPQLVMSSPKMHYPFAPRADGTRNYLFPSAKEIQIFEKLDGTCIIAYAYEAGGKFLYSYKTRLRPFLRASRFGDFYNMWKEVGMPYKEEIRRLMIKRECNLIFELWGARNPHLVMYKVPLAFSLLFGVTNTGRILSPTDLGALSWREAEGKYVEQAGLPVVSLMDVIDRDYVFHYESLQDALQSSLKEEEDGYYSGQEGAVFYLKSHDGRCIQLKCKPETIETIHFSAGAGAMSKNSVITTCWNAYENTDNPTVEFVKQLLLEEFKPEIVEANHYLVEKCVDFVRSQMEFRHQVVDLYHSLGKNILLEKAVVMREMARHFERNKMRRVYTIITNFA